MKKIKESANKTVLLKYLNSFCCIANAALFILAEILVHLNPKDFIRNKARRPSFALRLL